MYNSFDLSKNGGFMNDDNQGSTSKKKDQVRRTQNVVPLFISYINECTDEDFTLYGMPVQIADVVGVLRNFEVQSTKATCLIEGHSGSIKAILWLETDNDSLTVIPPVKENCYVRVFGSIRNQDDEKILMILKILTIDDLNVITNHHLHSIYVRLYSEKLASGALPSGDLSVAPSNTSAMGGMSFGNLHGLNPIQLKVMNLLKSSTSAKGLSMDEVLRKFDSSQTREVRAAVKFLVDEGHVYTTVDNDHFKATDA